MTSLHAAAMQGSLEEVQSCLENGCEIGIFDRRGNTALHIAAKYNHPDVLKAPLEAGASLERGKRESGGDPQEDCRDSCCPSISLRGQQEPAPKKKEPAPTPV